MFKMGEVQMSRRNEKLTEQGCELNNLLSSPLIDQEMWRANVLSRLDTLCGLLGYDMIKKLIEPKEAELSRE